MKNRSCQLVISGVGGQGVLFVTRLLAEAAIVKGLPVFTSETHGMAQRGGTVISHLKVGAFASPLINPGRADGLIALKAENLVQHHGYLQTGGWATVNHPIPQKMPAEFQQCCLDADRVAAESGDTRSLNLIMLGFTLACARQGRFEQSDLYCTLADVAAVLKTRLKDKPDRLQAALRALFAFENAV